MASKQSIKGSNFERELAKYFNEHVYGYEQCCRAPLSGGGKVGLVGGADLVGTTGLFVEAKRVEKLSFPEAMNQALTNTIKTRTSDMPVVINRRNRQSIGESYVLLQLDHFLEFYTAWLELKGYKTNNRTHEKDTIEFVVKTT